MRIISGHNKNRRITAPKNLPVRPTTDFAKESLFNILNNWYHLDEVSVLDLFSGTGNITYEFLSRGCEKIHSVDQSSLCTKFIQKTSESLGYSPTIIQRDVFKFLKQSNSNFDIVFADPPFDFEEDNYQKLIDTILDKPFLNEEGIFILETHNKVKFDHPMLFDDRKYGNIKLHFFQLPHSDKK